MEDIWDRDVVHLLRKITNEDSGICSFCGKNIGSKLKIHELTHVKVIELLVIENRQKIEQERMLKESRNLYLYGTKYVCETKNCQRTDTLKFDDSDNNFYCSNCWDDYYA